MEKTKKLIKKNFRRPNYTKSFCTCSNIYQHFAKVSGRLSQICDCNPIAYIPQINTHILSFIM